jgi:hypothetical protein
MTVRDGGAAQWTHATAILAGSWTGTMVRTLISQCSASARRAKANRWGARLFQRFAVLRPVERYAILSLMILIAVIGHLAMAWLLPSVSRPTPILSAGVLLAISLTVAATSARTRSFDPGSDGDTSAP